MNFPNTMSTYIGADEVERGLTGQRVRRVWTYWQELAGASPAPEWTSFNLMEVYQDAPIMLVMDVLPQSNSIDYLYRFVGTGIVQYRWKLPVPDHTGLRYSEAEHQYDFHEIKARYDQVASDARPILMQRDFDVYDSTGVHKRLILPLAGPKGDVDKLVVTVERLRETRKFVPDMPYRF